MEEVQKFYSQRAIAIATYFGGPLAAGYLVKKNYETLGQPGNARKSLIIGIIATILLLTGIFSLPKGTIDKIPNALFPLVYTGIIYLLVEKFQGKSLKNHKEAGGVFYSGWKAAGIGAIAMLVLLLGIALTAFIAGDLSNARLGFNTATYDKKVAKFVENENKALAVYSVIGTQKSDYLIKEFTKGIALWNENKKIVKELSTIENLPPKLINQNKLLLRYCNLRVEHSKIIIKAISENTDKYAPEIEKIGLEIGKVLEELKIEN